MNIDRAHVVAIIRDIRDAVCSDRATGLVRPKDPGACAVVQRACAAHGMSVEAWLAVLAADIELGRLFEQTLDELVTDPPDPGPYDEISRESSSGMADHDAFERDARLLGRSR